MIDASIGMKVIEQAVKTFRKSDELIGPEFVVAGKQTVDYVVKDLQRGVAQVTGNLKQNITGEVKNVVGVASENLFKATTAPYDYAGRLDKDGSLRWRSGKYKGYRTFGWFTTVIPKLIRKDAKRFYTRALERATIKLAHKLGMAGE